MRIIAKEQLSDISGGTMLPSLISSVTNAFKYEFGRQVVQGCYQAGSIVIGLFATPTPVAVSTFRDFNIPASYVATFAMGTLAGISLMKISQD